MRVVTRSQAYLKAGGLSAAQDFKFQTQTQRHFAPLASDQITNNSELASRDASRHGKDCRSKVQHFGEGAPSKIPEDTFLAASLAASTRPNQGQSLAGVPLCAQHSAASSSGIARGAASDRRWKLVMRRVPSLLVLFNHC